MRKLVAAAGLAGLLIVLGQAGSATAQTPQTAYEEGGAQAASPRLSFAQQAVYERAAFEAKERRERIESHKWAGHIPLRPVYYTSTLTWNSPRRGPWDHYYGGDYYFRHYPGYGPVRIW